MDIDIAPVGALELPCSGDDVRSFNIFRDACDVHAGARDGGGVEVESGSGERVLELPQSPGCPGNEHPTETEVAVFWTAVFTRLLWAMTQLGY